MISLTVESMIASITQVTFSYIVLALPISTSPLISITSSLLVPLLDDAMDDVELFVYQVG